MTTQIPQKIEKEVKTFVDEYEYKNQHEFIKEAILEKIAKLKQETFFEISNRVKKGLKKRGFTEKKILADFESKRI